LYNNTALSYFKSGALDTAKQYFLKALDYLQNNKTLAGESNIVEVGSGVVYGNLAQVLAAQGEMEEAEQYFKKSIAINSKKGNDTKDAQYASLHLAELYMRQGRSEEVLPVLTSVKLTLQTDPNDEAALKYNELMWKLHAKENRAAEALNYLEEYTLLKETITAKNKDFLQINVADQINSAQRQQEITLLRKDNQYQQRYMIAAILVALMALSIIVLIYVNVKHTKRHLASLKLLNTHLKDKKLALRKTLIELEKQNDAKDKILRIVAHDLRTPIHGISGLTQVLLDEPKLDAKQSSLLNLIRNACNDAQQLITEILEVAGMAEVKKLKKQSTDINALVNNSIELLQYKAAEKHQEIVFETETPGEDAFVNKEKIGRVVNNLISNAIKFSPPHKKIYVTTSKKLNGLWISVKDEGIGIPAELEFKVFDTFTVAKRPGTKGEKSFGLGLSICKQIIEAHDGKIWFESEPGKGTTFHVQIVAN
jgi:signal transduction histidine kinase